MPARIVCQFCKKELPDKEGLFNHQAEEHRLVYLPITEEWLNQLIQFMFTANPSLVDEDFVLYLQKFARNFAMNNIRKVNKT